MKTRILTLALVTVAVLIASGVSAKAGYIDTGFVVQLFSGDTIANTEAAPVNEGESVLSVETWTGGDNNNNTWIDNDNWSGIGGAGADDDLIFPQSAAQKANLNDFPVNTQFSSLTFTGTNYNITGNQIMLNGGIITNVPSGTMPIFGPNILMTADQTFNSADGHVELNGVINLQSFDLTLTGAGDHRFDGQLVAASIAAEVIKQGNGTATFNGSSPNAPGILVSGGTATIPPGVTWNAIGAPDNGGTLRVDGTIGVMSMQGGRLVGSGTFGAQNGGTGTIAPGPSANSAGILTSTGANSLSGIELEIDLNGTTVGTQYDRITATGGDYDLASASLSLSLGFTPSIGQTFSIVTTSGAGNTIIGQFAQGSAIVADGQIFTITYNPTSVVLTAQGSTLTWDGGGANNNWSTAANWSPNVAAADGLNLVFPAGAPADSLINGNNITDLDLGSITISGGGYDISGNAITLSGGIQRTAGTGLCDLDIPITLMAAQTFDGGNNVFVFGSGSTLNLNGFSLTAHAGTTGTFFLHSVISGAGGLVKTGEGTVQVTNSNTFTGVVNVNAGKLVDSNGSGLGAAGPSNNTVVAGGAVVQFANITTSEAFTLNAGSTLTSGGGVTPDLNGAIMLTGNDAIIDIPSAATITINGAITGAFQIAKTGTGTLVLGSNSPGSHAEVIAGILLVNGTYGAIRLNGGTIGGTGTVFNIQPLGGGGTVSPGTSPGTLTVVNNVATLDSDVTVSVELNGTAPSTTYDRLVAAGNVSLANANLTGSLGFNPAGGTQFTIIQAGSVTGQFAQGNSINIGGREFNITYNPTSVVLTAQPRLFGTVTYGNAIGSPNPRFVSNVTITGNGTPNVSTTTAAPGATAGQYILGGFGAGAYTVIPTKVGGVNGISSNDAARIAQHVSGAVLLTGNQLVVADVSNNGSISSFDAANIANFVVAGSPVGVSGTWRFSPISRPYASITTDLTSQDYSALLMGEVSGNWANSVARPAGTVVGGQWPVVGEEDEVGGRQLAVGSGPEQRVSVTAPQLTTTTDVEVVIPVSVERVADKEVISYEFDLRYDPSVIQPQKEPIELKGTVSDKLSFAVNAEEPGLLRVAVYGATAIDSDGVLLNLMFTAVGAPGSVSPLTWERIMLNEDENLTTTDGKIELSKADSDKAEITGRLLTAFGEGVPNTRVTLTDTNGQSRSVVSNKSGGYRFGQLQSGQTYTISIESSRYSFTPLTVSVTDRLASVDMIAEPLSKQD